MSENLRGARQRGKIKWRRIGDSDYAIPETLTLETESVSLAYAATITISNVTGAPECSELALRQKDGGPPITSEGLRRVPVARLVEWANGMLLARLQDPSRGLAGGVTTLSSPDEVTESSASAEAEKRTGRRRITDEDLQRLAAVCQRADATGTSYAALAQREMRLTPDQCRQWKRKAISAGFYTPPAKREATS